MNTTEKTKLQFAAITSANGRTHDAFTSDHCSHREAQEKLKEMIKHDQFKDDSFALSMWEAAEFDMLTPAKAYWLHRLATPRPARESVVIDTTKIEAAFAMANKKLRHPRFIIREGDTPVKIAMAGNNSRYRGSITVASPEFGEGWYGSIREGKFYPAKTCPPAIVQLVQKFADDPARIASAYGRKFGTCCFCQRELSTDESLVAGYGPVCAQHYGLPWGE